jgi:hypothetical protein
MPRALDLFCGAGGASMGLKVIRRRHFETTFWALHQYSRPWCQPVFRVVNVGSLPTRTSHPQPANRFPGGNRTTPGFADIDIKSEPTLTAGSRVIGDTHL